MLIKVASNRVNLNGLELPMRAVLRIAAEIWASNNYPFVVTSARDGLHHPGSLHYYGLAVDLRTWLTSYGPQWGNDTRNGIAGTLALELANVSPHYQVIPERTHIHIEYDDGRYGKGWQE